MTSWMNRAGAVVLAGAFVTVWGARAERDVTAQARKPILVDHLFTGSDGKTHHEKIEMKLTPGKATDLGGSANESAAPIAVTSLQFRRAAPNLLEDWHHPQRRQYVITLSGRGEVELESGQKIPIGPGSIFLSEDMTGKGHLTRGLGTEDRISLIIPLAEQK